MGIALSFYLFILLLEKRDSETWSRPYLLPNRPHLSLSPLFSLPNHPPYSLHPPQNPPLSLPLKVKVKTPPFHFHLFLIWFLFKFCYSNHFACFIHLLICCWEPLYSDLSLIADWCCHDFIDLCLFDWMICWLICSGCWLILL